MPQRKNPHEYYAVLGLRPGASAEELRRTWIKLVKQWHPDRFSRNPRLQVFAQEKLKEINEAYTFLRDYNPATGRSRYDTWQPSESYAGAYSAGQSRTGSQHRAYRYRPRPGPSPYEGDYQYRPVGESSPARFGFAWVVAVIFVLNVFSGMFRPYSESPTSPAPRHVTEVKLDVMPPESSTSVPPQAPYFVRGSSKADVYRIQGVPTSSNEMEWRYGSSRVYFTGDHVIGWESKPDFPLKAKEPDGSQGYFGIGSSMAQVLAVQGTPSYLGDNDWKYGQSSVQFSDGKVIGWQERPGSPLNVHGDLKQSRRSPANSL